MHGVSHPNLRGECRWIMLGFVRHIGEDSRSANPLHPHPQWAMEAPPHALPEGADSIRQPKASERIRGTECIHHYNVKPQPWICDGVSSKPRPRVVFTEWRIFLRQVCSVVGTGTDRSTAIAPLLYPSSHQDGRGCSEQPLIGPGKTFTLSMSCPTASGAEK